MGAREPHRLVRTAGRGRHHDHCGCLPSLASSVLRQFVDDPGPSERHPAQPATAASPPLRHERVGVPPGFALEIPFIVWFYNAAKLASQLGLPARRSPDLGNPRFHRPRRELLVPVSGSCRPATTRRPTAPHRGLVVGVSPGRHLAGTSAAHHWRLIVPGDVDSGPSAHWTCAVCIPTLYFGLRDDQRDHHRAASDSLPAVTYPALVPRPAGTLRTLRWWDGVQWTPWTAPRPPNGRLRTAATAVGRHRRGPAGLGSAAVGARPVLVPLLTYVVLIVGW